MNTYQVTRTYDGRSAEERRSERRDILLETGIRVIGSEGYSSISLNILCSEAGLTKRYFYESFKSVGELLRQAFQRISAEIQQEVITQIGNQESPDKMIKAGFQAFFEYLRSNPERARVFLIEALSITDARTNLFASGGGAVADFLLSTTHQFVTDDRIPKSVMTIMAQGAIGAAIFVGQNWIASECEQPVEELVQGVSEICFGIARQLNIPLDESLKTEPA